MGRIPPKDETIKVEKPAVSVKPEVKKPVEKIKEDRPLDKSLDILYDKERKRKPGSGKRGKFDIPEELKDPRFNYYWAIKSKVAKLESKDWSVVNDSKMNKEITGTTGSTVEIFGSIDQIEKETNHILMAKRVDYCEEDIAEKQAHNDKIETAIKGGTKNKVDSNYLPRDQKDVITK